MNLTEVQVIKAHYARRPEGGHWFSPSAMRFFRSRLAQYAYTSQDGLRSYFVSSEQYMYEGKVEPRLYTVRLYDWTTRDVETVGGFQAYRSRSGAHARAQALAEGNA